MSNALKIPAVLSTVADPQRLDLLLGLMAGSATGEAPGPQKDISRMQRVGLIDESGRTSPTLIADVFAACLDEMRSVLKDRRTPRTAGHDLTGLPFDAAGKLIEIPSNPRLRTTLLVWLADEAIPAGEMSEKQVNTALSAVSDDYVMLRRYLVDERLIERTPDGSVYRKTAA